MRVPALQNGSTHAQSSFVVCSDRIPSSELGDVAQRTQNPVLHGSESELLTVPLFFQTAELERRSSSVNNNCYIIIYNNIYRNLLE